MATKQKPTVAPATAKPGQGQPRPSRPNPPVDNLGTRVKVMATKVCYYDDKRYRIGDVFTISAERFPDGAPGGRGGKLREFSDKYMELVPEHTPERITTGAEILKQEHDRVATSRTDRTTPPEQAKRPSDQSLDDDN